ncbi:MAG: hypothetical protein KatS3mg111_2364 [Pirellulaceae bacterium]|nr:MAG: hypothetical protein KatS3mg111_2364 [Pirellulaceae bacterium]
MWKSTRSEFSRLGEVIKRDGSTVAQFKIAVPTGAVAAIAKGKYEITVDPHNRYRLLEWLYTFERGIKTQAVWWSIVVMRRQLLFPKREIYTLVVPGKEEERVTAWERTFLHQRSAGSGSVRVVVLRDRGCGVRVRAVLLVVVRPVRRGSRSLPFRLHRDASEAGLRP